jgi:hypothetical protein
MNPELIERIRQQFSSKAERLEAFRKMLSIPDHDGVMRTVTPAEIEVWVNSVYAVPLRVPKYNIHAPSQVITYDPTYFAGLPEEDQEVEWTGAFGYLFLFWFYGCRGNQRDWIVVGNIVGYYPGDPPELTSREQFVQQQPLPSTTGVVPPWTMAQQPKPPTIPSPVNSVQSAGRVVRSGSTKRVWEIADSMPGAARSAVVAACVAEGINKNTAGTQYAHWAKARRDK